VTTKELPTPPSYSEALSNLPVIPLEPPPPSPLEQQVSQLFQNPEFLRNFLGVLTLMPERGMMLLNFLNVVAPRAFAPNEQEFRRQWLQTALQMRREVTQEALLPLQLQQAEYERARREYEGQLAMLLQNIPKVMTPRELVSVDVMARRTLMPQDYTTFRSLWKNQLVTVASALPSAQRSQFLEGLVRRGYLTETEKGEVEALLKGDMVALETQRVTLQTAANQLKNYRRLAQAVGMPVEEIDATLNEVQRLDSLMQEGVPLDARTFQTLLASISKVTADAGRHITTLRVQFARQLERLNSQLAQVLMNPRNLPNWLSFVREQVGLLKTFDPEVARKLSGMLTAGVRMGTAQALEGIQAVLDAADQTLSQLETQFPELVSEASLQLLMNQTRNLVAQGKEAVQNLTEKAKTLEQNIQEVLKSPSLDKTLPTQVLQRAQLYLRQKDQRLRELGLMLRERLGEAALRLREQEMRFRQSVDAWRRDYYNQRLALEAFRTGLSSLRLFASLPTISLLWTGRKPMSLSEVRQLANTITTIRSRIVTLRNLLANNLLLSDEEREVLTREVEQLEPIAEALQSQLNDALRKNTTPSSAEQSQLLQRMWRLFENIEGMAQRFGIVEPLPIPLPSEAQPPAPRQPSPSPQQRQTPTPSSQRPSRSRPSGKPPKDALEWLFGR